MLPRTGADVVHLARLGALLLGLGAAALIARAGLAHPMALRLLPLPATRPGGPGPTA